MMDGVRITNREVCGVSDREGGGVVEFGAKSVCENMYLSYIRQRESSQGVVGTDESRNTRTDCGTAVLC
jgi:hypothetical protein